MLQRSHAPVGQSRRATTATLALLVALSLTLPSIEASATTRRTLTGTATAHLHLVSADGSDLIEEGFVTGALHGTARAKLNTGVTFSASFTIHTRAGSITGHGHATPHGSGRYQSFSGSFLASSGTGRYAHIRGSAGLYGVIDRRTDSVLIQATAGTLVY
jgi:hypothetical protein